MFENSEVKNLEVVNSDHSTIFLNPLAMSHTFIKRFKFENS